MTALPEPAENAVEVGLQVRDLEAMLQFYLDGLACEPYGEIPVSEHQHVWGMTCGGTVIKLNHLKETPEAANPPGRAVGLRYLSIRVRDVQATFERCVGAGASVQSEPSTFTLASGATVGVAFICDPDGNMIELVEGDAWTTPSAAWPTPS